MTFGQTITWTGFYGNKASYSISGCSTETEARSKAIESATAMGWKPRRWWEFWRWNDINVLIEDYT